MDTVSMNQASSLHYSKPYNQQYGTIDRRSKYNTLTPAEAKKIKGFLNSNTRLPARTASVLHKPRAPPLLVNNDLKHVVPQPSNQGTPKLAAAPLRSSRDNITTTNSTSTTTLTATKVFQNQIGSLKRFFRYMPMRRSLLGNSINDNSLQKNETRDRKDLSESISQICLDRSQSPPICPPPPKELKSMTYMDSSKTYSNYDEFTRLRNQKASTLLRNNQYQSRNENENPELNHNCDYNDSMSGYCDSDSWQLQSLPVNFERNLKTVVEERQNLFTNVWPKNKTTPNEYANHDTNNNGRQFISPPTNFDDNNYKHHAADFVDHPMSMSNSTTSLTTTDSVLDYHRHTSTSFRFSYAQPNATLRVNSQRYNGLPPKMPTSDNAQDRSPHSNKLTNGYSTNGGANENLGPSNESINCDSVEYTNGFENEGDITVLSDTSTLHGDSTNMVYVNKCAELERTVESLKNKLISKEKEMTELQLKQWSSDYLIGQLKSTIIKLEKENAQLKAVVVKQNKADLS